MVGVLFVSKRTHFLPLFFNKLSIQKKNRFNEKKA